MIESHPQDRMIFIVGRGRSGTTLLKSILDSHPLISVAPEGLFIMNLYRKYRSGAWTEKRIARFAHELFLERRLRRWSVTRDDLSRRWRALGSECTFARLCAEVYEAHADASNKQPFRLLGDKNPHYALFVHDLRAAFPHARFIHMVRDYRDNVLSYLNVPFDLKSPFALAYRWVQYNTEILQAERQDPTRFHRLRFEDLVSEPAQTLDALCRFLAVESEPIVIHRPRAVTYGRDWHRHLGEPIDPRMAEQWRLRLSRKQVAGLDRICQPFAGEFGYAPIESDGPASPRLLVGRTMGWSATALERQVFRLPMSVQALLINTYRRLTGNVIR